METIYYPTAGADTNPNTSLEGDTTSEIFLEISAGIFLTVVVLMNFLLNPPMLCVLYRVTSIQPTTKIFMASLTMSDLGTGIIWLIRLPGVFAGKWLLGDFLCAISGVFGYIFQSLNLLSLVLLTIDRYIAVSRPLRYPTLMTVFRSKILICAKWTTIVIVGILLYGIYHPRRVEQLGSRQLCSWRMDNVRGVFGLLAVVFWQTVIIILYLRISLIARKQARRIAAENQADNGQGGHRINTRSIATIVIITGTLVITWIPNIILLLVPLVNGSSPNTYINYLLTYFATGFVISNSWLNVIIYYLRNKQLRRVMLVLLSDWRHRLVQNF
ncbi:histamine H2 receptor-like [Acanthaster planci]|uniref:Histamine H2 receptor-like n=1 Tax=Acanthaster planci TaxID=133434 RepID=A0A8B7YJT7_ACAPL|nr:histamine H2 receptor-like [Acanthaster planci]